MSSPSVSPTMSVFSTPRSHKQATRAEQLIHRIGENRYVVSTNLNVDRRAGFRAHTNEQGQPVYFNSFDEADQVAKKVFESLSGKPGLDSTSLISQTIWEDEAESKAESKSAQPDTDQFVASRPRSYQRATNPDQLVHKIDDTTYFVNATLQAGERAPIREYIDENHPTGKFSTKEEALQVAQELLNQK